MSIFYLGVGVGNGSIRLGKNSIFSSSVQKGLPGDLDYSSVEQVYDTLRTTYDGQLDINELLDGLKQGLVSASKDPYSEYLNPEQAKEFNQELNGCLEGIGAQLGKEENFIVIIAPIAGYPAEKAGIKAKDIVVEINGESTAGMSITDAVSKIRGAVGTTVKLKIIRGESEELDFEIKRERICIPSVESSVENGIGYMKITQFSEDTVKLAREAANNFKRQNIKGVILDVRSNPGGLLEASVDVAGIWLDDKTVTKEKRDEKVVRTYTTNSNTILEGIPTVVLINEGSASASEIVAGALKDNNAATLIGVTSFGKGSVQQLQTLPAGGVLKVTIARWFTPNDKNIDKTGIEPDKKVDLTAEDSKAGRDPQKEAALQELMR